MSEGKVKTEDEVLADGNVATNMGGKPIIAFVKFTISLFLEMQAGTVKEITKEIYRPCESECASQEQ